MAVDPAAYAAALKVVLDAGLTTVLNVHAFPEADALIEAPALIIEPGSPFIEYDITFSAAGVIKVNFDLRIKLNSPAGEGDAWRLLYSLVGVGSATSIIDLLRVDRRLASTVEDVYVGTVLKPTWSTDGDGRMELEAVFPLSVYDRKA